MAIRLLIALVGVTLIAGTFPVRPCQCSHEDASGQSVCCDPAKGFDSPREHNPVSDSENSCCGASKEGGKPTPYGRDGESNWIKLCCCDQGVAALPSPQQDGLDGPLEERVESPAASGAAAREPPTVVQQRTTGPPSQQALRASPSPYLTNCALLF